MRALPVGITVASVLLSNPQTSAAYDLGYHADQTIQAMAQFGFGMDGREIVVNANMNVDIAVNVKSPTMVGIPPLRRVHWDDRFGLTAHASQRAWLLSRLPVLSRLDCSETDNVYEYAAVMGFVLHGIQDYYAHSNHAELNTRYQTPGGTFEEMVQPAPGFERLAAVLAQNVPVDEGEALISGAYFTSPPPEITDSQGKDTHLEHDRLNKDNRESRGGADYLYPAYERRRMHDLSSRQAVRDSATVLEKFRTANPGCFAALRAYKFGRLERFWNVAGRSKSQALGSTFGHWRSGNPTMIGAGLEATILPPTGYPDAPATPRKTWGYLIKNTGDETITSITLDASEALRIADPPSAPQGWTAVRDGNAIRWTATGSGLAPLAAIEIEVNPAIGASPGYTELTTDSGRAVWVVGPVAPDVQIALSIRAAAFVDNQDAKQILDAHDVPAEARLVHSDSPPIKPPGISPRGGCAGCGTSGDSEAPFVLALVTGLLLRRRSSQQSCHGFW